MQIILTILVKRLIQNTYIGLKIFFKVQKSLPENTSFDLSFSLLLFCWYTPKLNFLILDLNLGCLESLGVICKLLVQ